MLRIEAERIEEGRLEVRLSDKIRATASMEGSAALQVQPLDISPSPEWDVSQRPKPQRTPLPGGRIRWEQTLLLSPAKPGNLQLALQPLLFREDPSSDRWEQVTWKTVAVHVGTEVLEPDVRELRDVTGPEQLPPVYVWRVPVAWAILPLGLVACGLGIVYYRRHRRRRTALPADQWAMRELDRLSNLPVATQADVDHFYTILSNIVRQYLEQRFQLPAQEQTTAEFVVEMQRSPHLTADQQELLRELLEHCDLAKFARQIASSEECHAGLAAARRLIAQTTPSAPLR